MIESFELKKFIIRFYLDHSISPIEEISKKLFLYFQNHFIPQEIVKVKSTEKKGKIITAAKESYTVEIEGSVEKKSFYQLEREERIEQAEIKRFLEANTKISPFGRVLRKNVLQQISQPQSEASQPQNDDIVFDYEGKIDKKKELEKKKKKERLVTEPINYNTRNFTANEFLKSQNDKTTFMKKDLFSDDVKESIFLSQQPEKERLTNENISLGKELKVKPKETTLEILKNKSKKINNESELLTLKIKELLKMFDFKTQSGETDLAFKKKINTLLDSKAIKNHPEEISIKRKLVDLLSNPNSSNEFIKFRVNELINQPEKKKVKQEEKIDLVSLLNEEEYEEIVVEGVNDTGLFISVYFFFFYFRKYFLFKMTFKRFISFITSTNQNKNELINEVMNDELNQPIENNTSKNDLINELKNDELKSEINFESEKDSFKIDNTSINDNNSNNIINPNTFINNKLLINLDDKSDSELFFILIKCLLEILQEEYLSISKTQFKSLIENALLISVTENKETGYSPCKKYDWHECKITLENWRVILKNFYSFIFNVLECEKITSFREMTSPTDRLTNFHFLIQCCYSTNKFRQIINLAVEENRMLEKNKNDLTSRLRVLQSKINFNLDNKDRIKEEISVIEDQLYNTGLDLLTCGYKAEIVLVDGCLFLFMDGVCFWKDNKFYRMSNEQVIRFVDKIKKDVKIYSNFYNSLSLWLNRVMNDLKLSYIIN